MARPLPLPKDPSRVKWVDPFANPSAFARVIAEIYRAEYAALQVFRLLDDPEIVLQNEMFRGAKRMLVQDEHKHMVEFEEIVAALGFSKMPPASPESRTFWRKLKSFYQKGSPWLPAKPSTMALFTLTSEGLGYAFLHQLTSATVEGDIRARLEANLKDEQRHLQVSISLLRRAARDEPFILAEIAIYMRAFLMMARRPGRAQHEALRALGIDYFESMSSMLLFLRRLVIEALRDTDRIDEASLRQWDPFAEIMYSPLAMRAAYPLMYLPEIPIFSQFAARWSVFDRWLRERKQRSRGRSKDGWADR